MDPYRIFLSSPGDVLAERERAELVVRRLNAERPEGRQIKLIRWEQDYYLATRGSFQDQIAKPSQCDLVVCIFWRRLGSELPESYARNDGTIPTGTEFEFEDALGAAEQSDPRLPGVMVFKKEAANFETTLESLEMERRQYERFQAFWQRWFRNEKGHFLAAFNAFADTDAFERMFERNLRSWLDDQESHVEWRNGSPYRGLEAFNVEHAPIFFGRRRETERARARLIQAAMSGTAFLLITGASGAGKSSLARAGLLAMLAQPGGLGSLSTAMRYAIVTPGEIARDWARGLADALFSSRAIAAELEQGDFAEPEMLASQLRRADASATGPVLGALRRAGAILTKVQSRADLATVTLVLLVDQLEEVFAWPKPDAEAFFTLLHHLATAKGHPIWVVATIRSDFQHRLSEFAALDRLAGRSEIRGPDDGERTLELVLPRAADLKNMITRPARAAGAGFEVRDERDLAQIIEAEARPELMPAVQLLLNELYQRREGQVMTLAAHDALGGVAGVMARRGDEVLEAAAPAAREALPRLARALVTQVRDDAPASARRVPESAFADDAGARQLLAALREARLVVSHQGELRFAHESILNGWKRLKDIIVGERRLYEARQRIEETYRRYRKLDPASQRNLLLSGLNLAEARELLSQWGEKSLADREPGIPAYIAASDAAEKSAGRRKMMALGAVAAALAVFAGVATKFWFDSAAARDTAVIAEARARDEATKAAAARDETAAALTRTTVALKLVESGNDLAEGNVESAAGKAAEAHALAPGFETRSALLKAGLGISPHLEARIRHPDVARIMTFWDADHVAIADVKGTIAIYAIATGKVTRRWDLAKALPKYDLAETPVRALAPLGGGAMLAVTSQGAIIVAEAAGQVWASSNGRDETVTQVTITALEGNRLTLAMIVDDIAQRRVCTIDPGRQAAACTETAIEPEMRAISFHEAGNRALVIGQQSARLIADGQPRAVNIKVDRAQASLHSALPLASVAREDGDIDLFDLTSTREVADVRIGGVNTNSPRKTVPPVAWHPEAQTIAYSCGMAVVCVANVVKNARLSFVPTRRLAGHANMITAIVWSSDGKRLFTRDVDNRLHVWSLEAADTSIASPVFPDRPWEIASLAAPADMAAITTERPELMLLRGRQVLRVWPASNEIALRLISDKIVSTNVDRITLYPRSGEGEPAILPAPCVLSHHEHLLDLGKGRIAVMCEDHRIALMETAGNAPPVFLNPEGTDEAPFGFVFDATRNQIIVSYRDGSLHVFDAAKAAHSGTLATTHADNLVGAETLSVTADGRHMALSGSGPYVLLYDLAARRSIARLPVSGSEDVGPVVFDATGKRLAAVNGADRIMLWTFADGVATPWASFKIPVEIQAYRLRTASRLDWLGDAVAASGGITVLPVRLDEAAWMKRLDHLGYRLDKRGD